MRQGVAGLPTLSGIGLTWLTNQRAESETLNRSRRRGGGASDLHGPQQFHFTIVPDRKIPIILKDRVETPLIYFVYIQIFSFQCYFHHIHVKTEKLLESRGLKRDKLEFLLFYCLYTQSAYDSLAFSRPLGLSTNVMFIIA